MIIIEAITNITGLVAPLPKSNVDTDIIIPKEFLKHIGRKGFDKYLMYDWRFDQEGKKKEDFVLNDERYTNSSILLTKRNFGIGSSRENAVWALKDFGFKVIIAESFADIFKINCSKNGVLLIELDGQIIDELFDKEAKSRQGLYLEIELNEQLIVNTNDQSTISFDVDPLIKIKLLNGWDDIDMTMKSIDKITQYEEKRPSYFSPSI